MEEWQDSRDVSLLLTIANSDTRYGEPKLELSQSQGMLSLPPLALSFSVWVTAELGLKSTLTIRQSGR